MYCIREIREKVLSLENLWKLKLKSFLLVLAC